MRRFSIFAIAAVCLAMGAGAQSVIHGNGDPRTLHPVPNCASSRFFVDDATGQMYQANQGSPCNWDLPGAAIPGVSPDGSNGIAVTGNVKAAKVVASTNATINVQAAPYNLACDGTTDDTTAFQTAVTAGEAAGSLLIFPANATCKITGAISISGIVRWQGSNTTILMQPAAVTQAMFTGSGINPLDIIGFTFQGSSNTVAAFFISGGTNRNLNFHGSVFTGITGCPANPNTWLNASIVLSAASHVRIKESSFLAGGCSSYWNTSGPYGAAVYNFTSPSYDWDISGNTVDNTYADMGLLLFNLFESTIHDNNVRNVVLGGTTDANSSGYGIAIYGTQICGGATAASPSGLSRTSNVVTFTPTGTCSPALVTGDHIGLVGSTSVGTTGFDGAYTVVTGGTTSFTARLDSGVSLANDTGGGGTGGLSYLPRLNRIHDNATYNTAGSGIYVQTNSDTTVSNNTLVNACQSMDDTSLPCGMVAANFNQRTAITGNVGSGSVKDGMISVSGIGVVVANNTLGGVRYGVRLRGADTRDVVMGNSVNGATEPVLVDGAAQMNALIGNTLGGSSSSTIALGNSSAFFNMFIANMMDGGLVTGIVGLSDITGSNNIFALNFAHAFRGSSFDIRTPFNLTAMNYVYGGTGNGFATASASYNLLSRNYCISQTTCMADGGTGVSNVFLENYMSGATTALSNINGWAFGNYVKGGSAGAGNFPVAGCTLVGGTCTISNTEVLSTDNGKIWCTRGSTGANPGYPFVSTITAGTSYVVTSTSATDTGNVACSISH